jgi:hypothetical protein
MEKKLEDCLGKEVHLCIKESTAYFSGRECNLDCVTDKYHNFSFKLEKITSEFLEGKLVDGKKKEIPFLKRSYHDTSSEAKDLIRRYNCVEQEIVSVKYNDEVVYKHGTLKT